MTTPSRPRRLLASLALALVLLPVAALAQAPTDELNACVQLSFKQLARQQRLYRTVVLGRGTAAAAPQGSVWYDDETGDAWLKEDDNAWRSIPSDVTRSDGQMEGNVERDPEWDSVFRRGIVETRTTLTSSLVPSLTQAFRALQCRLETVCSLATNQLVGDGEGGGESSVDGCLPPSQLGLDSMAACRFTEISASRDALDALSACRVSAAAIVAHEAEALRLLTAYDAATRTSLQYAGVLDRLVRSVRYPLIWPLIELSDLVRDVARIPCFLGICAP